MDASRWSEVKALFQAALALPAEQRNGFVSRQCAEPRMLAEVLKLLGAHDAAPDFLASPIGAGTTGSADPLIGRSLGGFVIQRRIGAGGMGVVYEAEQLRPRRPAAVKVIRPGLASPERLRRFEYEAEVLARLEHPGIARIYAAGSADLGDGPQPWLAMELVRGHTLTAHVRQCTPPLRQKVQLLAALCDAVQHAHQQGVVHRDLKPANIIVGDDAASAGSHEAGASDGAGLNATPRRHSVKSLLPQPKILDFGVARVIDADARATMHTAAGELLGTLSYMSPEQLSGDPNQVDTRSDVHALGIIGFELLAGRLPFARPSSLVEVVRAIEREEPKKLGAVDARLRGDLEVIIAKALEKDRARRYSSAGELAADLRRYLSDEPVLARKASALYQFRKFAGRHRAWVVGVLATMVALAAGLVLYAVEADRARREAAGSKYEAAKATAVNNFITNDFLMNLLAAAHSAENGQRLPVGELVDQAAARIGVMYANEPLSEAAVRNEVGTIYYNLGSFEQAAREFRGALERWEGQLGPLHPDTLKAVNNLGQALMHLRRGAEAEPLYRRALEGRLRVLGEHDPYTLVSMNNLAELLRTSGREQEAEAMLRRALQAQQRVQGEGHKNTITTMANLGSLLVECGKEDEGLRLHRRAYELCRESLGAEHVTTLIAASRLAQTLRKVGEPAEAAALQVDVVAGFERTVGGAHASTIMARRALARTYAALGNREASAEQLQRALAGVEGSVDPSESLKRAILNDMEALTASQPASAPHQR